MKKYLLPLALMSALLVSCEKPENKEPELEPEYAISVSPTEITFGVEGGDAEVTITITNSDEWRMWGISSMPDWIEITEQYGENGATITVTAKEYNAEAESRSGEIVFIYENKDAKVSVTQKADESPIIQFKDPKFLEAVLSENVDMNGDGQISEKEASLCTYLYIAHGGIRNLEEIKYFTALTGLYCDGNQLTTLDVSNNTALTDLSCNSNQLTSLDVSKNTALTDLSCYNNQLTTLDVSNNIALTYLDCNSNQLTSLDVSKNTALIGLYCNSNQLTSLDVSKNTALTELSCEENQLTSLDVSNNTSLERLGCHSNDITIIDASMCRGLKRFRCVSYGFSLIDGTVSPNYSTKLPLESLKIYKYYIIDEDDMTAIEEVYGDVLEFVE